MLSTPRILQRRTLKPGVKTKAHGIPQSWGLNRGKPQALPRRPPCPTVPSPVLRSFLKWKIPRPHPHPRALPLHPGGDTAAGRV